MTWLRRAALLLALASAACTTGGTGARDAQPRARRSGDVITEAEIRAGQWSDAYAMIAALRSGWLRTPGPESILGETDQVQVYLNDVRLGGLATLRGLAVNDIARVQRVRPVDAAARWGPGHSNGAIVVTTRAAAR